MSELAKENWEIRKDYLEQSSDWRSEAWDNINFYHNIQWTSEQAKELKRRGQMPLKIDRTSPIIEQKVAIATANSPTWTVSPVGWGADQIKANTRRMLLEHAWDYSQASVALRDAVEASFVVGRGVLWIRHDPLADYGRGEVVIECLPNPQDVLVDPNSRRRDWEDADNILFSRVMTLRQARSFFADKYWSTIKSQAGIHTTEEVSYKVDRYAGESQKHVGDDDYKPGDKVLVVERYAKDIVTVHVLTSVVEGLKSKEVTTLTDEDKQLIGAGYYRYLPIKQQRVKRVCTVGDELLYDEKLPISMYPFAPIICRHMGNPFSLGEIHRIKDQQMSINKRHALLIHDAAVGTNPRTMYPENSIDSKYWADNQSLPGALLPYTPGYEGGKPETIVPNTSTSMAILGRIIESEKDNMEYTMGIYRGDQGDPSNAPRTLGQTLAYKEYGATRIRDYLKTAVEPALVKSGKVFFEYIPTVYTKEKVLKVTDLEGRDQSLTINQKQYVQTAQGTVEEVLNDVKEGRYDVRVQAGSTMQTNPGAIQQHFIELANIGAMDREGIIRNDPYVKDKEGLIGRLNERDMLKQQVQQLQQMAKRQGQTIKMQENEILHSRMDRNEAMHKAVLKDEEYKARAHLQVMKKKMELSVKDKEKPADTQSKKLPRRKLKGAK